jgi:acetyl esterase/lipase
VPATINIADVDPLRDEGEAYTQDLSADGVQVQLERYIGVSHPSNSLTPHSPK